MRYQDINLGDNIMAAKSLFRAKKLMKLKGTVLSIGIWKLMDVSKPHFWCYCFQAVKILSIEKDPNIDLKSLWSDSLVDEL